MRVDDLDIKDLLSLDQERGVIRFAGQRALLVDAMAMGLLRRYLTENLGQSAARAVLTQFGFAQGWRMAEAMRQEFEWDSDDDWRRAGIRLHAIEGLFHLDTGGLDPLGPMGLTVAHSFEAEQHLAHFGRAEVSVCWTICGLLSGYLSRVEGREVYVLEDRCVGKGDAACHMVGRTREGWQSEHAHELHYFESAGLAACLDVSLQHVVDSLKASEAAWLRQRRVHTRPEHEVIEPLGFVYKSPAMRQLVDLAMRVAQVDSTVLITGESGTGKERIARLLHDASPRASGPFVAVNCGAITETLLESELFGHARGAFTGATQDRPGLFEAAHKGTLLLDEVGEISPAMQVKLLRVLQEREVRRVGENKSRPFDVRVVSATNRGLSQGVTGGTFRQDLFYRLKVVELHVPALRERRDDILPLARLLLGEQARRMKRKISSFSPAVADHLLRYPWPGNVRELENAMERAVALARAARVELEDLPEEVRQVAPVPVAPTGAVRPLEDVEKEYILAALELNGGNQTRTADQLLIGSATLYRKLKSYGRISGRKAVIADANGEG